MPTTRSVRWWTPARFLTNWVREALDEFDSTSDRPQKPKGILKKPTREDFANVSDLLYSFSFPLDEAPFASAPIRSSPSRTYDPHRPRPIRRARIYRPYFASVHFRDKKSWLRLKEQLEHFGRRSGLFDENRREATRRHGGRTISTANQKGREAQGESEAEPDRCRIRREPGAAGACGALSRRRVADVALSATRGSSAPKRPGRPRHLVLRNGGGRPATSSSKPTATISSIEFSSTFGTSAPTCGRKTCRFSFFSVTISMFAFIRFASTTKGTYSMRPKDIGVSSGTS